MKSALCFYIAILVTSVAYSQRNETDAQRTAKFISFYNSGQADNLQNLLSDEMKAKVPVSAITGAIQQLKAALGNLTKSDYYLSDKGISTYIATFERSGPVLYINFDQTHNVTGFFANADQRESPGTYTVKTADATLKGTLSLPDVNVPVPIVLLIAGSGPTDRDGNSVLQAGKSNYFKQITDALRLKSIAVLRYDKRGVGQSSTKKPAIEITFDDFVNDAAAIIKTLKADQRFSKVIVAGHSEGSLVGMMAIEREKADAFISLEGAGEPIDLILKRQLKTAFQPIDYTIAAKIIDSVKAGHFVKQISNANVNEVLSPASQPYLYSWMKYNPQQEITKLTVPVMIIQGTHDMQVSVSDAQALKKAYPKAQLKLISNMSHVLKDGPADRAQNLATYGLPDLPLHPELVPALVQFVESLK